jgi:hypothetical protein
VKNEESKKADKGTKDDKSGKDPPDREGKKDGAGVEKQDTLDADKNELDEDKKNVQEREKAENSVEKEKVDSGATKQLSGKEGGDGDKREEKLLNALEQQRKEQEQVLKEQKAILQELKEHKEKEHEVRPSAGSQP